MEEEDLHKLCLHTYGRGNWKNATLLLVSLLHNGELSIYHFISTIIILSGLISMCKIQKTETVFFSYQASIKGYMLRYEWVYINIMLLCEFMKVFTTKSAFFKFLIPVLYFSVRKNLKSKRNGCKSSSWSVQLWGSCCSAKPLCSD